MKIRYCFVGNSSSSSFVIPSNKLTIKQMKMIVDHIDEYINLYKQRKISVEDPWWDDIEDLRRQEWNIELSEESVKGETSMDNFDMKDFLEDIVKVNPNDITWEEGHW